MNLKIALLVKTKTKKFLDFGFIRPIDYSTWISNIFIVVKPDGHFRMCTNLRDLKKLSLKDDFSLPNIDMIVDSKM